MFELAFESLAAERPEWGRVAIIPWDSALFGFSVAEYSPGNSTSSAASGGALRRRLGEWAEQSGAELIACSVDANDLRWRELLPELDFRFVDLTLSIAIRRLQSLKLPPTRMAVRQADAEDLDDVEHIAHTAFNHGRYHADPRFPRQLADLRYRQWVHNARGDPRGQELVYVAGPRGAIKAFFQVRVEGEVGRLGIQAVHPAATRGFAALDVIIGTLTHLRDRGLRQALGSVSAANTGVVNLSAYAGFRFHDPRASFHWRAPHAPHLIEFQKVFEQVPLAAGQLT